MDRRSRGLTLGLALLAALAAPSALAAPPAWVVRGPAGQELWLLGSVHYLTDEDYPLPPLVDDLYSRAHALVMEIDLDDLDPGAAQAAFAAAALLPDGVSLEQRVTPDVYARTQAAARELGLALGPFRRYEPWLVALTLLQRQMAEHGYRPEAGIERYLLERAARDGKDVLGLEQVEAQVQVFDRLSPRDQQAVLEQTLEELDDADASLRELATAWRDGRLETLAAGLSEEFDAFPTLYDALVVERNEAWIDDIERLLDAGGGHLIVVGALHLVGEHNVPELLRARGLGVEPVH
ncbi:MAG TPA: TraB/GumN family protein [Gammaproteobacteria bacterium]